MARLISYRFSGLLLVPALTVSACVAQAAAPAPQMPTQEQQSVCNRHHEGTKYCARLAKEFADRNLAAGKPVADLDNPFTFSDEFALRVSLSSDFAKQLALQTLSTSAAVNQAGGAPGAAGSTNLVMKPTVTDFISLAAESGAFTDTINGTTMTLQANALGLTKYFANQPVFGRWQSRYADRIQPLTFTVTLDVAQSGPSSAAPTAGSANAATPPSIASVLLPTNNASFSSFAVNYTVWRPYNPQDKKFLGAWDDALTANQSAIQDATRNIAAEVNKLFPPESVAPGFTQHIFEQVGATALNAWHQAATAAENGNAFDAFVSAYATYQDAFAHAVLATPDAPANVLALLRAIDAFNQAVYSVLDKARGTPLATLSYLYSAPQGKPATHNATVALSYLFKGDNPKRRTPLTGAQLTANFTTSIYASLPAGAAYGRLRDFQLSGEFDKPFGGTLDDPRGTWSLAGYGQYQYDPTVLNITAGNLVPGTNISLPGDAQVLLGTTGWLGVAQGKLVINLRKSLSIPVAVKWSNRTDLLKDTDVRGQVGISYDLSALSRLISGK
jgi:hypothetical protein